MYAPHVTQRLKALGFKNAALYVVEKDINDESLIKFTRGKIVMAAKVIFLTNNATKTCFKPSNVLWKAKDYSTKNSKSPTNFF